MNRQIAFIWLVVLVLVVLHALITKTDRYFWKGVGYTSLIMVAVGLTFIAINVLVSGGLLK